MAQRSSGRGAQPEEGRVGGGGSKEQLQGRTDRRGESRRRLKGTAAGAHGLTRGEKLGGGSKAAGAHSPTGRGEMAAAAGAHGPTRRGKRRLAARRGAAARVHSPTRGGRGGGSR